jgi:hypothetical protein
MEYMPTLKRIEPTLGWLDGVERSQQITCWSVLTA